MAGEKRATPRVREHVDRLRAAGMDTARFFDALCQLRDDSALPKAHREAIYKLIAMESFIWYLEALRNEPIDREKLLAQAKEVASQPAIVKRTPGDQASALAKADIGKAPSAPKADAMEVKPGAAAKASAPATAGKPAPARPTAPATPAPPAAARAAPVTGAVPRPAPSTAAKPPAPRPPPTKK